MQPDLFEEAAYDFKNTNARNCLGSGGRMCTAVKHSGAKAMTRCTPARTTPRAMSDRCIDGDAAQGEQNHGTRRRPVSSNMAPRCDGTMWQTPHPIEHRLDLAP